MNDMSTDSAATTGKREPFAPWASFRAYDVNGLNVNFCMSFDTVGELVSNLATLSDMLIERGWSPAYGYGAPTGAPTQMPTSGASNGAAAAAQSNGGIAPLCPTHGTPMKASKFEGGGHYCTQKIADDDGTGKAVYCKQKSA